LNGTIMVKFDFSQSVNGRVQGKRIPRWPFQAKFVLHVEAAWALAVQINGRP